MKNNKLGEKSNLIWIMYFSIFFTTMSLFIYETVLTRLFSVILSYNLVFIVISLAILGSGLGGIIAYNMLNNRKYKENILVVSAIILPISFIISLSIMYFLPFVPAFYLYIPAAVLPFILGGIITSIIFEKKPTNSSGLYFMDLIGSAIGSLLIIKLMNSFGYLRSVIAVIILATISAISISMIYRKKRYMILSSSLLIIMVLLLANNNLLNIIENKFNAYYTSPATVIEHLKNSNEKFEISFSKWDAISRTDVIDIDESNEKIIVTDGGASAPIKI